MPISSFGVRRLNHLIKRGILADPGRSTISLTIPLGACCSNPIRDGVCERPLPPWAAIPLVGGDASEASEGVAHTASPIGVAQHAVKPVLCYPCSGLFDAAVRPTWREPHDHGITEPVNTLNIICYERQQYQSVCIHGVPNTTCTTAQHRNSAPSNRAGCNRSLRPRFCLYLARRAGTGFAAKGNPSALVQRSV
jgi:hypothetical protein